MCAVDQGCEIKPSQSHVKIRRDLERGIALESKTNHKMFCYHVRRKLKARSGRCTPNMRNINDENTRKYNDKEKAEILQNQFSSVFNQETDVTR